MANGTRELHKALPLAMASDLALIVGRQIATELAVGNIEAAREILDRRWDEHLAGGGPTSEELLELPISELGIEDRIANALEQAGILTLRHLLFKRPAQLRSIRNLGEFAVNRLRQIGARWAERYHELHQREVTQWRNTT